MDQISSASASKIVCGLEMSGCFADEIGDQTKQSLHQ
jgi:hypothetical protein